MKLTKLISLVLLANLLIFSALQAEEELSKISRKYYCLVTDQSANYLYQTRGSNLEEIAFRSALAELRSRIANLKSSRSNYIKNNNYVAYSVASSKIRNITDVINKIKDCRRQNPPFVINQEQGGSNNAPIACQVAGSSTGRTERIIAGRECAVGDTPVVMLNLYDRFGDNLGSCTGTVVSKRAVISAAHCVEDGVEEIEIVTGRGSFWTTNLAGHPDFGYQNDLEINDVSIIISNQDLPVRIAKLHKAGSLNRSETAVIAGYGLDENENAGLLKAAPTKIDSFTGSAITIRYFSNQGLGNTCSGDSGGPLFVKRGNDWLLAGVTSNGILDNCGSGDVSNFANLADNSNRDFIESYAGNIF